VYTGNSYKIESAKTSHDFHLKALHRKFNVKNLEPWFITQLMNIYICLHVGYLKELNIIVVCAICLLDIKYDEKRLHNRVSHV